MTHSDSSLSEMCFAGDEADLQLTANTQPAILTVSVAAYQCSTGRGLARARFCRRSQSWRIFGTGRCGRFGFCRCSADGPKTRHVYAGSGAGRRRCDGGDTRARCCGRRSRLRRGRQGQVCSPANINSPSQVVIAGNTEAVDRACEILKGKGAKRAIKLNVSAPFHCASDDAGTGAARGRSAGDLDTDHFEFPIVHNVDADGECDRFAVVTER